MAAADACIRRPPKTTQSGPSGPPMEVRFDVHLLAGESGRALAAAQGRVLSALLASVAEVEVGQDEEVSP